MDPSGAGGAQQGTALAAVATLMVWVMTLLIQRSEHRDTQAIHAKLDGYSGRMMLQAATSQNR
jgi:low affinity Fe/Cu permease